MMIRTTAFRIVPIVLLLVTWAAGTAMGKDFLSVAANAPTVNLAPRNPGRNFVRLPTLEYRFEIHTQCSDSRSPESLSLNVADTRKSLRADKIAEDGPTEISLRIPASQIAPLVVEDFCIVPPEAGGEQMMEAPAQITIPAALSAQASLLCASDEGQAMTYVSRALDVSLVCDPQQDDTESGAE
jgi:hypothetical protein